MKFLLFISLVILGTLAEESELLKDFTVGNNQFTADVYKEYIKTKSGSFSICPVSVDMVLALFHAGAKGKTAEQLADALHLPESHQVIQETFSELSSHLQTTEDYDLDNANKVYVSETFQISNNFKDTAVNVFSADIQNINFNKKQEAATEMNSWVEEKTHQKIKNLISPDDLGQDLSAVLINAMYFRGDWVKRFRKVFDKDFHINSEEKVVVPMMELSDNFFAYESSELNAKFLEMPYHGKKAKMTFVLPNDIEGISRLEAHMEDVLAHPDYIKGPAHVIIPKFTTETTIQFKPILEALGIVEPFSSSADFSGIGANKEPLTISKIIQKTFIEVDKEGTTASAGTAGFAGLTGMRRPAPTVEFIADHPFLYYIKVEGIVLFVGRYNGV